MKIIIYAIKSSFKIFFLSGNGLQDYPSKYIILHVFLFSIAQFFQLERSQVALNPMFRSGLFFLNGVEISYEINIDDGAYSIN